VADPTEHLHHPKRLVSPAPSVTYAPNDEVDFVIVGSGAAGGIVARELSRKGFRIVVLEQGPYRRTTDFGHHDEIASWYRSDLTIDAELQPDTYRATENDVAEKKGMIWYGRGVGGGSVHFTANFWRFHPIDFHERSKYGDVAGAALADWPITYDDLEPYYTKVDWEIGVSGLAGSSPVEPRRSRPYPMPPLPVKPEGLLMEKGAKAMGWTAFPAPMAIASKAYRGRAACGACGFCIAFGCEYGAKSSTLVSMIPDAEKTGKCEIRPESYVRKVQTDDSGKVTGVIYFNAKKEEIFQKAKAVVLCANGAETPKLLLMSASNRFPQGLANSSGLVGRHLMFNGNSVANGVFEHETNGWKGPVVTRVVHDTYELDPEKVGFVGGGGFDFRWGASPVQFALRARGLNAATWGAAYKQQLRQYGHSVSSFGHTTSLPVPTNSISLDPTLKDAWGLPAMRVTFEEHANDLKVYQWFMDRAVELLEHAGAQSTSHGRVGGVPGKAMHLLGTCRMGNDPKTSVVNASHRAHDVPNLFIVDGSSFVTGGRGQPTMTIMALAFRASDQIAKWARSQRG
jgi:choline dehydrogenase-like flavoprotein